MRLYDAWLFKSEEWQRRPLGLHPDAESALVEAKENHPDVVSVECVVGHETWCTTENRCCTDEGPVIPRTTDA